MVGPAVTYVYPSVDAAANVYAAVVSFPPSGARSMIYVTRSSDDGRSWSRFVPVTAVGMLPGCCLPNTTFRDGITEHFAASPTHPGPPMPNSTPATAKPNIRGAALPTAIQLGVLRPDGCMYRAVP